MARSHGQFVDRSRFWKYIEDRNRGFSRREIERAGGPSARWQSMFEAPEGSYSHDQMSAKRRSELEHWLRDYAERQNKSVVDPGKFRAHPDAMQRALRGGELNEHAERAINDFEYFRLRYFGHVSMPWHIEAARIALESYEADDRVFICENVFPGSGKSTLKRDIVAWLIVRNRAIRALWGAATIRLAMRETSWIRSAFQRTAPMMGDPDEIERGRAADAVATLAEDFGIFKPAHVGGDIWTGEMFTVVQVDGQPSAEKEATLTAFGRDSQVLGWRVHLSVWDDLVNRKNHRTLEGRDDLEEWFIQEAESRVEPNGLLLLDGQRIHGDDLYWRRLQERIAVEFDADYITVGDGEDADIGPDARTKYHHIIFPAHDDTRCPGEHLRGKPGDPHHPDNAKPWPEGCLLDPYRMPWYGAGGLLMMRTNNSRMYDLTYQQKDVSEADVLVPKVYITGGIDPEDGSLCPGCWDDDRELATLPGDLAPTLVSVCTADPSPTKFWAIGWWVVQFRPDGETAFLMDLRRQSMDAPDFLDWLPERQTHIGLMEDWQKRSVELGFPIKHWIVENNAAQRFLLQYNHVRTWMAKHHVRIHPHSTGANKADPELGIGMLRNWYKFGRIRLPGKDTAIEATRTASLKLVSEITRYPQGGTDDCVMMNWFLLHNLEKIRPAANHIETPSPRPSWLGELAGR